MSASQIYHPESRFVKKKKKEKEKKVRKKQQTKKYYTACESISHSVMSDSLRPHGL